MSKKLLVAAAVVAVSVSSSAFADLNKQGFYVGANAGVSRADDGSLFKNGVENYHKRTGDAAEYKQGGFGWGALAGYQFNRNFAVEGGYVRYANNTYKFGDSRDNIKLTHKVQAWNLLGKVILPVGDSNFDIYAKAGVAYQIAKYDGKFKAAGVTHDSGNESNKGFRPVAGVGAAYNFDNGLAVDVSWTRVFGSGKTNLAANDDVNIAQPNSDLIALGLTYTFQNWA